MPAVDSTRSAVLGDIQKAGGIGALKKVDRSLVRDRSAAVVGGGGDTGPHGSGLPPAGVAPGGGNDMASALAAALSARNKKVSHSGKLDSLVLHFCGLDTDALPDDEADDDDW